MLCPTELTRKLTFKLHHVLSKWVIIVQPIMSNFSTKSWWEQVIFNKTMMMSALLDFYSASSLKKIVRSRYVIPFRHIILIRRQPVFALNPKCCLLREATNTNAIYYSLWFNPTWVRTNDLPHTHANHYNTDAAYLPVLEIVQTNLFTSILNIT